MLNRTPFVVSGCGLALALVSAYLFSQQPNAQPPAFNPAANPYANGIYANGIVESAQPQGSNVNIYPEVAGPVTRVAAAEGALVHKGDLLLQIDDSVQRATAEQLAAQAEAARVTLQELKAEPRPETLAVARAQRDNAAAGAKNAEDQLAKIERSYGLDPKSVSANDLDIARDTAQIARTNFDVVDRQFALTRAGAWTYDVQNQQKQALALTKAAAAAATLADKYAIRAPLDGIVRSVQATVGSYVSPQGTFDPYTQGLGPLIVMGAPENRLQVRVYVDEILIHRLGDPARITAQMFIRGTETHVPLSFDRVQPYVSPKIELSDQRQERVDVRVLPLIFHFDKPQSLTIYPGQLVDVYVGTK
jgi:HlyD family secretion protein